MGAALAAALGVTGIFTGYLRVFYFANAFEVVVYLLPGPLAIVAGLFLRGRAKRESNVGLRRFATVGVALGASGFVIGLLMLMYALFFYEGG